MSCATPAKPLRPEKTCKYATFSWCASWIAPRRSGVRVPLAPLREPLLPRGFSSSGARSGRWDFGCASRENGPDVPRLPPSARISRTRTRSRGSRSRRSAPRRPRAISGGAELVRPPARRPPRLLAPPPDPGGEFVRIAHRAVRVALEPARRVARRCRIEERDHAAAESAVKAAVAEGLADRLRREHGPRHHRDEARAPYCPLGRCGVSHVVRYACQRAGVVEVRAHRLRHGAATQMHREGAGLIEIGQVLRHRHTTTTTINARTDPQALAELARPWPTAGVGS